MTSRMRKNLIKAAVPIAHLFAGTLGGLGALHSVQPSESIQITAVNIDVTSSVGNSISLFGEKVTPSFGVNQDVDVTLIDKRNYPKAIDDAVEIFGANIPAHRGASQTQTPPTIEQRLENKYGDDVRSMMGRLFIKNVLVFSSGALAGSAFLQGALWLHQRNNSKEPQRISFIKRLGIPFATAFIVGGSVQAYNAHQLANNPHIVDNIEKIISAPIEDYLITGTSKMAVNLDSVANEIQKDIRRLSGIQRALEKGSASIREEPQETWTYLIVSDSHNLPTVPENIQELLRATHADGVIALGDFIDVGLPQEVDALSGSTIGDTTFLGFNNIARCADTREQETCNSPGEKYPKYSLLGNHDTTSMRATLDSLGFNDLERNTPKGLTNIFALSDACNVDATDDACLTDYHEANRLKATSKLTVLRSQLNRDPHIVDPTNNDDSIGINIGFFASRDAAKEFVGEIPVIFYGGDHKFSAQIIDSTKIIGVPSIGQGGARPSDYAGAVLATFGVTTEGETTLLSCNDIRFDITTPGRGSIQACFR